MNIVAMDIATRLGLAMGRAGETPRAISVDLGKAQGEAQRFARLLRLTRETLERFTPDLVVYEAAIGGPRGDLMLKGMIACVVGQATLMGYRTEALNLHTVRKHFLGRDLKAKDFPLLSAPAAKRAIKQAVIDRCRALGWGDMDADAADACACWDYAQATRGRGQAAPLGELFQRRAG